MKPTRRQFLATGLASGAVVAADMTFAETTSKPRWKSGLGLNGFMSSGQTFKKTYPIKQVIDFAVKQGFSGVELVNGWPKGPYPSPHEPEQVAEVKHTYNRHGLQVYSIQTGGPGVYAASASARKKWLDHFADTLRLCTLLGCDFVGHWPGGPLCGNANVDQAIKSLAAGYREAAKMCADQGMFLSFEIEPPFIFNTPEHLERIIAETNHPACKTNYDPSHFDLMSGSKGKPEQMLERIGVKNIGHVHLTDTDGTLFGGTSKHLPCGDGHCDIQASLKTLWDGGYTGWIMIDAWKIEDAYRAATQGKQAIDKAIADLS